MCIRDRFYVVEPFLKKHYDGMERRDILKQRYDIDKFPKYEYEVLSLIHILSERAASSRCFVVFCMFRAPFVCICFINSGLPILQP